MIGETKNSRRNELRGATVSETHAHRLDIVDILSLSYIVSVYSLATNQEWSWVSMALGSLMLAILLFRHILVSPLRFPGLFWAPWLFVVFNIVSLFWSRDTAQAIDEIKMISSAVIGAAAIWLAIQNGSSVKSIVYGMMIGSIILIVSSIGEVPNAGGEERISGLTGNANALAMYLSYAFMLVWCVQEETIGRLRILGTGLVTYAFFYTGSRKLVVILLVLVIFLVTYFISNFNKAGMWKRLGLTFLLLVAIIWSQDWRLLVHRASDLWDTNQVVARTLMFEERRDESSAGIRKKMITVALDLWAKSPIVGHGSGQFTVKGGFGMYSHNNYTELLANLGIVGLGLYCILPIALLVRALRSMKRFARKTPFWTNILAVVLALFVLSWAMVSMTSKIYWVLLVVLMTLVEKEERMQVSPYREFDRDGYRFHQRLLRSSAPDLSASK